MKKGTGPWSLFSYAALILSLASVGQADSFSYISGFTVGTVTGANWSTMSNPVAFAAQGTTFASGSMTQTTGGNTITITDSDGQPMIWEDQGSGWQSGGGSPNFSSGELLIVTDNPDTLQASGLTLTLTFSSDIQEFGIDVQDFSYSSPFDAFISVNGGSTLNTDYFEVGSNGNVAFLGVEDTSGAGISAVTLSVPFAGSPSYFALGTASIIVGNVTVTSVPEPGSLLFMAGGIAALGWKMRRRARA